MGSDIIELVPADPEGWAARFEAVRARLVSLLPDAEVEHIGSTSIPELPAKDVVDVLVGVNVHQWTTAMGSLSSDGFDCEGHREGHAWFSLPDRTNREIVIHLVQIHGHQWHRRIKFRDILRKDIRARDRYLTVKREATVNTKDWGAHTRYKADVVDAILEGAGESD
ncbi:GrpB family protein [Paenarthrobacter sp. UW852]|uniref:GrpB family protein n=1 Tax=Paenarthrobacter sp. UW852 TaxID=2951989 RepID=UPI00214866B0|nr:GrpB family protein [Paenarthrobacter sp. UW852]MCR1161834.1 GrpB family protein [Paenarthrobacter sp. UW852]